MISAQATFLSAVAQPLLGDSLHRIVVDFDRLIAPKRVQPWRSTRTLTEFPTYRGTSGLPRCTGVQQKLGRAGRKRAAGSPSGTAFSDRSHEVAGAAA